MDLLTKRIPELRDTENWPVPFRFTEAGRAAADGLLVVYDYTRDIDLGAGRYSLPSLIEAFVDRPDLPRMQLRISVGPVGPFCTRLVLVARPGEPLRASRTRVPLERLVKEIAAIVGAFNIETGNHDPAGFERELAALAPRLEPGKRLPDEHLKQVADVYRYALGKGLAPTNSVAEAFNVSRSTAGRWVVETRRRGLLGPAIPGVAGEQQPSEPKGA